MAQSPFPMQHPVTYLGDYVRGEFHPPVDPNGEWKLASPAAAGDEIARIRYSYAVVDEAVQAARRAFRDWRLLSAAERAVYLKKFQEALKRREAQICEIISREVGKPLWEAKTEFTAMINKVDITINESMKYVADLSIPDVLPKTAGHARYRPHGVMAVIGPFNFPGHLPNGHLMPALATGNTVIFKPSEKTPMTGQVMAECFHEAGFPPGVFNLVQGEREVGRRLCTHEGVAGVLFTGSYEVGTRIKQDTLTQHWKILALEMGGKNSSIVWEDADLEHAVYEVLTSAFLTTGQRCSATSRVMVHASFADQFVAKLHERAKAFAIGHPFDNPFMGPLIDASSVDRYLKFQPIATREGFEPIMRGKPLDTRHGGHYVTPAISYATEYSLEACRKSVYQQTELFAPNVSIIGVKDLDHAVALANATQYGLVTSVFSRSRKVFDHCYRDLETGLINWNRGTVGASSRLPFGGFKKSGNHQPTALTSTLYCAAPVASLETEMPEMPTTRLPGLG